MKILIVGKKGIGKTKLIQERIIPKLKEFTVVDFNFEYLEQINAPYAQYHLYKGLTLEESKKCLVSELLQNKSKTNTFILDDICFLDNKLNWLEDLIKDKNVVISIQSVQSIISKELPEIFNEIYFFKTCDSSDIYDEYVQRQMDKGVKTHIISGNPFA